MSSQAPFVSLVIVFFSMGSLSAAEPFHPINNVAQQPLSAATGRLVEALQFAGAPLSAEEKEKLSAASVSENEREAAIAIQEVLDPYCVAFVHINAESRVEAEPGPAKPAGP